MTNPNHQLADAIREVTAAVQKALDDGHRSRKIDADDLVEVLLSIADRLDPPVREPNHVQFPCPKCGEVDADRLVWQDDEFVRCSSCGTIYCPGN
ncbi:MAG: hypothetical protein DWH91_00125 [Planctomycetota bacterium]|nr:MAG: hypothetical protein DWH91_00125 [Planctomycetota bacterium]